MRPTAGPVVLDALYAFGVASLDPDVEVVDGFTMSTAPGSAVQFIIGVSDPSDLNAAPAVESTQRPIDDDEGGYSTQRRETMIVRCQLVTYPTETLKASRDHLVSVLTILDAALRADRSLGGAVLDAHLGPDFALHQADGPSGDRLRYDLVIVADCLL